MKHHLDQENDTFFDDSESGNTSKKEREGDDFALETLIPKTVWQGEILATSKQREKSEPPPKSYPFALPSLLVDYAKKIRTTGFTERSSDLVLYVIKRMLH